MTDRRGRSAAPQLISPERSRRPFVSRPILIRWFEATKHLLKKKNPSYLLMTKMVNVWFTEASPLEA